MLAEREITADHEGWQQPGADPQWSDSFYFGGADARGLAFYTRIGARPNESRNGQGGTTGTAGTTEAALGAWLPDQGFLLAFARAGLRDEIACGHAEYRCTVPALLWELRFNGRGRIFERAEHVATARDRYREASVHGRLLFTAWSDPLEFCGGLESGVASRHYEQPGSVAGTLTVDGRRHPLAGRGLRDHSWGVRNWQGVPYWRWFGMVVDPDTFLLVNNIGREDGGESVGGFVMRDGVLAPVIACTTHSELDPELACQRSFELELTDARDRRTGLRGRALEVAPLRQRRDRRTTVVNEGLTEYDWEGIKGIGISEYLIQEPGKRGADDGP